MFTVLVPYRDERGAILRLLASLPNDLSIVVVDDASAEPLQLQSENVKVIRRETRGYFAGAVNTGLREIRGNVLIVNQDITLSGDAWRTLLAERREDYALIGDGVHSHPCWPMGYVQGTFMFLRADLRERLPELNEKDFPLWGGTAEYQLRVVRAGFRALPLRHVPGMEHARGSLPYGETISRLLRERSEEKERFLQTPPLVSVIVPCYNHGRYLRSCIASLLGGATDLGPHPGQTLQAFDVHIVDDASLDETREVGEALADPWQGINYLRMPKRGGTPRAINAGIKQARGKYIAILDADDMREAGSLERLYREAEAHPHSMIYDDVDIFQDGKLLRHWVLQEYDFEQLIYKNHVPAGILFPRAAWKEVGGYPELMTDGREDWAFNVALGLKGYCGRRVSTPGYLYRREGQGRTTHNGTRGWRARFQASMRQLFPALYAGERPMGCCGGGRRRALSPESAFGGGAARRGGAASPEGWVTLEYLGGNSGSMRFTGPVTGQSYVFGGSRRVGPVRAADVAGMLEKRDNRRALFRRAQIEESKTLPPSPPSGEAEAQAKPNAKISARAETVEAEKTVDVSALTIAELKALDLTGYDLRALLEQEREGHNRKGVTEYLEGLISYAT